MIYQGTPKEQTSQVHYTIIYNPEEKKWKCVQCGTTAETQDKGNIIRHTLKAHPERTTIVYKTQLTLEERLISRIRVGTLERKESDQENTKSIPEDTNIRNMHRQRR